jgi:hypothetical protein
LEEFCEQLEVFAREKNELGTVSTRHVQRLAAGRLTSEQLRPATTRLLEGFFESSIDKLLASPENTPHKEAGSSVQTSELSTQKSDLLAQIDRTRHMMDRAIAERSITPAQVDKIDQMVRLHAQACVRMPPLVMLRRLVADFDDLRRLVSQAQSPTTLVRLYACSARIGALVADELMVLGETHRAWSWHHCAIVTYRFVRWGILIPLYSGDSREALSMAVETCNLSGFIVKRSSPAYALAVTLKALSSRNEISYPFGGIVRPATCDDANFGVFVTSFQLLILAQFGSMDAWAQTVVATDLYSSRF